LSRSVQKTRENSLTHAYVLSKAILFLAKRNLY